MPHVGSSSTSTLGTRRRLRPNSTFCWLPPLNAVIGEPRAGRLDRQLFDQLDALGRLFLVAQPAAPPVAVDVGQCHVVSDRRQRNDALRRTVGRHEGHPRTDRVAWRVVLHEVAVDRHVAGVAGRLAGDETGAAGSRPEPVIPATPTIFSRQHRQIEVS